MRDTDGGTTPPSDNDMRPVLIQRGRPYQGGVLYEAQAGHPRNVAHPEIL